MTNKIKKIIILLFCGFFLASCNFCFALEGTYPRNWDGSTITSNTPLPEFLKYVFDIGFALGITTVILSLVYAGILYLLSPALPAARASAKDRVFGALTGLIILLTFYLLVVTVNPELTFFRLKELPKIANPVDPGKPAGVYFYKNNNCSGNTDVKTSNIYDLGDELRNQIKSVKIINNAGNEYISIVYNAIGLQGKCQEINSGVNCDPINRWPASASVHKYDFAPSGDGVYLYHKSFFNKDGGYYKIPNIDIDPYNIYSEELANLKFTGDGSDCTVPKDEQKCTEWDTKGNCTKRECPNLAERNISSIEIKGNYIVLLVYFGPKDQEFGPWTFCQEFPTQNDVNKDGPKQIKWEDILSNGKLPNYILIYPVKEK